jgi:hypothetical protein
MVNHVNPNRTDDEWVTTTLYPLKTWEWHDGMQE